MMGPFAPNDLPLTRRTIDLMLLALAATLLPHLLHLPAMIALFCIAFGCWRWMAAHYAWPLPNAWTRAVLTLVALAGVYLGFGTVFGRDAGTALLVIMMGLKLLEVQRFRDAVIVLFLGYFLVVTMVLHSQSLGVFALLVVALLLITMALIALNHPGNHPGNDTGNHSAQARIPLHVLARRGGGLLLQALPLMLIMFLLFPRIPGPLWGLPSDAYGGTTGLSDSMSPGSISQLSRSDAVAFRVSFKDDPPPAPARYWRGPVFWYTDGVNWSSDRQQDLPAPAQRPAFTPLGTPLTYTVTLEPHNQRWLFALEMASTPAQDSTFTEDLFLLADKPVRRLAQYTVTSHTEYRTAPLSDDDRARALQLPGAHPRTRALATAWRAEGATDAGIVQRSLRHFREEPFHYTLSPPPLGRDAIDEFMFSTRRGFCEHYAAAFTIMMRAAGIPARIVTGYQGGELNTVGDYLIVRQRDAHAWSEVWFEDQGWVRIDPTSAVAPHRIERGSRDALERERSGAFGALDWGLASGLWNRTRLGWDALNNHWNQWVLAYGPASQVALLSRLGLQSWLGMALAMVGSLVLILSVFVLVLLAQRQQRPDPAVRLYQRFCARLARRGVVRLPHEGPVVFAARAGQRRPDLEGPIETISRLYIAIRYGGLRSPELIRRLRREVTAFRP